MIPPPSPEDLRCGHKLVAGMSYSTVIAEIDFETRSAAGFVWNHSTQKFESPRGSSKRGLSAVGMAVYSEHPSTDIICMAYNLKDGFGIREWMPGQPLPIDLFIHLQQGGLLEAWNVGFEFYIWNNVATKLYHYPPLSPSSLRCAAAKSRAYSLPGSLGDCGTVLGIKNGKLNEGKKLIKRYCEPRNPSKNNPEIWNKLVGNDILAMVIYNHHDILAESEISMQVPDLIPQELEFWQVDQTINRRGVRLDRPMIEACIKIVEQAHAKYNAELPQLTGGAVVSASQIQRIQKWMNSYGVFSPSLDEEHIDELLKTSLDPSVRRVLEIRQLIGSAAVKKLYAMLNYMCADGRVRELFTYHTARTGRAGGSKIQPQNLPNSNDVMVSHCAPCDRYYNGLWCCPYCGGGYGDKQEWNSSAVSDALQVIATGSLTAVELFFGEAIATVSGCLRGMFIASPGSNLLCSDYSSIEGIVLAMLAGEEWAIEVYRTHGFMYEMTASKITGTPFEELLRFKRETGKHHSDRKIGKVASLACFAPDTQVLTDRGYVVIKDVRRSDKLWDGKEWVAHKGIIHKGKRKVIVLDGVRMTPEHPISLGNSWKEARLLVSNVSMLTQALVLASRNLPCSLLKLQRESEFNAPVVQNRIRLLSEIYARVNPLAAMRALKNNLRKLGSSFTPVIATLFPTQSTDEDYLIESPPPSPDATHRIQKISQLMAKGEYQCSMNGEKTGQNSLNISSPLMAGMFRILRWIVSIITGTMNRVTFSLFPAKIMRTINAACTNLRENLGNYEHVYDIAHAGSRNCFTIKTNSGHLIVHNSGYQGALGAWLKFKADEFLTEDQILKSVWAWRDANPNIVRMWKELETAAHMATLNKGVEFGYREIVFIRVADVLYCRLPSGRYLTYHRPQISPDLQRPGKMQLSYEGWNTDATKGAPGWTRMNTYGGKITENVVQAVARDILAHAIVNLEHRGYPVVLHIHDEIVCEMPEGHGSVEELEAIMMELPQWASGWPIKATGGWRAKRYRK